MARPQVDVNFFTPEAIADPYPLYEQIRGVGGIVWNGLLGAWMAVDYDLVSEITLDNATFEIGNRPVQFVIRNVMRDVVIGGQPLTAGENVYAFYAAANRDPARWVSPARFDVRRERKTNMGFGHGPHLCLGAPLARLEVRWNGSLSDVIALVSSRGLPVLDGSSPRPAAAGPGVSGLAIA